ncbi:MAG: threonine-phosphate decarboxylase [Hyphomicrobiales bacterium]|nr:threonine-phosphate decarboxylase [Hyphomicrobiales bacterium]
MAGRTWAAGYEALAYHGGALDVARRLCPEAPAPWIDLSTGVNPHAYPLPDLARDVWTRLPDSDALAGLEAVAGSHYGAKPETVVAGPGSQALIQSLARIAPKGAVAALGPTYRGHAEAFGAAGVPLPEAASLDTLAEVDVAVVVNPNNPDGRVASRVDLLDLHERLSRRGGWLIVDEAFADFDGQDESLAPVLPAKGAVVLRSFGKAYGLAGLRLGFAIASPEIAETLRTALGSWPVSGPAIAIGARALADPDWTATISARLGEDAARLDGLLETSGWRIIGGTRLFRLAARGDAEGAFRRLLSAGIVTRPFAKAPDRLRFGIPAEEAHWERLSAALRA